VSLLNADSFLTPKEGLRYHKLLENLALSVTTYCHNALS